MRVHHILVVILIAREISGLRPGSDAYPSIISMLRRIPKLHLVFDRNIFEFMELIVNDVRMNNKGFCDDIRGPVGPRVQTLLGDIHSLVNITQLEGDTIAAVSQGKWDTYFNHYCQKVPTFIEIIENATILMKPCLPSWLQPSGFQLQYNSTSLFSRILCQNDGNNTASFMNNGGVECLASSQEAIRVCDRESIFPYYTAFKNGQLILLFNLGLEKCRDVEKYRNCIVTALRTCQHPEPASTLDSLFDLYKSWTDCQSIQASITGSDVTVVKKKE